MKKNKKVFVIVGAVLAVVMVVLGVYFGVYLPKERAYKEYVSTVEKENAVISSLNEAITAYNGKVKEIEDKNTELDEGIAAASDLINSGRTPYEGEKITVLNNRIKEARNERTELPGIKEAVTSNTVDESVKRKSKAEIEKVISETTAITTQMEAQIASVKSEMGALEVPDYTNTLAELQTGSDELENSYRMQEQITEPTQDWVMARLSRVENIATMAPVTEENDPNGRLNKQGGYTATIYFMSPLLGTEELTDDAIIDIGTEGGGAVEVYKTVAEAEGRDNYLTTADMYYPSGSHHVFGTMVIRTSKNLKASEQQRMEEAIKQAMLELD